MKLLALCAFLFVCLLCLSAFTVEGRTIKKVCCPRLPKLNNEAHKGTILKIMEKRKYCKPCPPPARLVVPGPLPQLK